MGNAKQTLLLLLLLHVFAIICNRLHSPSTYIEISFLMQNYVAAVAVLVGESSLQHEIKLAKL